MADSTVADPPRPPSNFIPVANDFDALPVPPLDQAFFDQDMALSDPNGLNFHPLDQDDVVIDDLDFDLDFTFDDLLPASLGPPTLPSDPVQIDSNCFTLSGSDPNRLQFPPDRSLMNVSRAFKTTSPECLHISGEFVHSDGANPNSSSSPEPELCQMQGDQVSGGQSSGVNHFSGDRVPDVSAYLNVSSPESNGSKGSNDSRVLNCPSPESQASEDCGSDFSEDSNKSVNSSSNFGNISVENSVSAQNIKFEELNNTSNSNPLLKRKKESEDSSNFDSRTSKSRKSHYNLSNDVDDCTNNVVLTEEDEKRRARLMRNRESAQLSRQRKKHYVDELEDKVRNMGSTIQDLNGRISYIMAENATLRQQLGGGRVPPPPMAPPAAGMYPQMMYPWMPYGAPPYMVKPQGSQVPLVPIPRLKPQQTVSAPKASKKAVNKKSEGKTKKVASVSFLGLLFFMLLFGGLVPMVNVRYGGVREAFSSGSNYVGNQLYENHCGRVLTMDGNMSGTDFGEKSGGRRDFVNSRHHSRDHGGGGELSMDTVKDESVHLVNGSEPLVASLYVPRNDKLVKIDGNLIIHSVLASEKAMASREDPDEKVGGETRLAVPLDLAPVLPVSGGRPAHLRRNPTERQRALGSASTKDSFKSTAADGRLQQWFREGLAGPMLSSGMCTEVFQFDVSSAIVPATPKRNVSEEQRPNSTNLNKGRNRRFLNGLPGPLPGSSHNISDDHTGRSSQKENFNGNNSLSPMVVSVLVDPREVSDIDGGVMGPKSLSRIFVVVLIDSVKYVTYSCMLPFKGAVLS